MNCPYSWPITKAKWLHAAFTTVILFIFIIISTPANAAWRWRKTTLPVALVVEGLWAEYFKVPEALDKIGMRCDSAMRELPYYAAIVLVNAHISQLPDNMRKHLREFVEQGGGLVVLGGLSSYDNGGYIGSVLEPLLPVSLEHSRIWHSHSPRPWLVLARAETADWPLAFDFCAAAPSVQYFHGLVPRDGASIQLKAGTEPVLISGAYGLGRVVACALTVNGEPTADTKPFWNWQDWPLVLAQAIEWAAANRPIGDAPPLIGPDISDLKPLTDAEIMSSALALDDLPPDFVPRAVAYPNASAASTLFDLAIPDSSKNNVASSSSEMSASQDSKVDCELHAVLKALIPFARPDWAPRLIKEAGSMNPSIENRRAALILLGACGDPTVYQALLTALHRPETEQAAIEGLGRLGNTNAIPLLNERFERALAPARLPERPGRWKPAEFASGAGIAVSAAVALYRLGDADGISRLYALAADLHLYLRIYRNALKRRTSTPQADGTAGRLQAEQGLLQHAWNNLHANLAPVPLKQREAFAQYAAAATNNLVIELLASAMEHSTGPWPETTHQTFAGAQSQLIARMAKITINTNSIQQK